MHQAPLPHKLCSVEQQHFSITWELVGVCSLEIRIRSDGARDSISTRSQVMQKHTALRNAVAGRAGLSSSPAKPSTFSLYQPPPLTHRRHLIRRRQWHPPPVLVPGKSQGRRSLVGCSPWGRKESDRTEQLHFQFSFSSIGERNGIPLQCSCLENPRDGGAWWAAVYGVAQSRKRLSSSSRHLINSDWLMS